jgi:hypothetical protein
VRPALPARGKVSPSVPAQDGPEELLREAEPGESERGARRTVPEAAAWAPQPGAAMAVSVRQQAAVAAGEPGVPQAAVSGHAAAEPRPGVATAVSVRQQAVAAEVEPGELQAAGQVAAAEPGVPQAAEVAAAGPDGPQVAGEAVVARPGAAVRPRAAVERAEVQPRAVRRAAGARQAVPLLAVPSAAASVFRQGPCLAAGPARAGAAAHFAPAMQSLRIASRSEPSSQAARNEDWSWWRTSPEGSLTKCV